MKSQYIQPQIMVCDIEKTQIMVGSEVIPPSEICNCHGSDCDCGMDICHNPNNCINGCGNKVKEINYFYDE